MIFKLCQIKRWFKPFNFFFLKPMTVFLWFGSLLFCCSIACNQCRSLQLEGCNARRKSCWSAEQTRVTHLHTLTAQETTLCSCSTHTVMLSFMLMLQLQSPNTRWTQPSSSVAYYPEWALVFKDSFFFLFSPPLLFCTFEVNGLYHLVSRPSFNLADTHKFNQFLGFKNSVRSLLWKIPLTFMVGGCDKWRMC